MSGLLQLESRQTSLNREKREQELQEMRERAERAERRWAGEFLAPDWLTPPNWKTTRANKITIRRDKNHYVAYYKGKNIDVFTVHDNQAFIRRAADRTASNMGKRMGKNIFATRGKAGDYVFRSRNANGHTKVEAVLSPADVLASVPDMLPRINFNEERKPVSRAAMQNAVRRQINYEAWQATDPRRRFEEEQARRKKTSDILWYTFCFGIWADLMLKDSA